MQTSSSSLSVVNGFSAAHRGAPALRVRQDPRQPQRLRLSGSFGEVCRALEALTRDEQQSGLNRSH